MVKLGDKVSKDSPLLVVDSETPAPAATKSPSPAAAPVAAPAAAPVPSTAPAADSQSSPEAIEVTVPDIGDFKDVEVIELLVKPGDTVAKDQSLITVESDKASMEIPSSHAGTVREPRVKLGDKVSKERRSPP